MSRARRLPLAIAVAATVVVVAAVVHRVVAPAGHPAPAPVTTPVAATSGAGAAAVPVGPTTVVAGVPMGYRHDRAGAIAAALGFLRVSPKVIAMGEPAAVAAQRTMATTAAADTLTAALRANLAAVRDGFGPGPLGYRVAPLAVRVAVTDPDHVEVDLWYVAVIEPAGRAAYADWRVMAYTLVSERGDWHEAAEHDQPGPHPADLDAQPTAPAEWDAALAGFESLGAGDG